MNSARNYASAMAFRVALEDRLPKAIYETFQRRKTHRIPPSLISPPASWSKPFSEMAVECGLAPDMKEQFAVVAQFFGSLRL